jgi:hypothetical protein
MNAPGAPQQALNGGVLASSALSLNPLAMLKFWNKKPTAPAPQAPEANAADTDASNPALHEALAQVGEQGSVQDSHQPFRVPAAEPVEARPLPPPLPPAPAPPADEPHVP